MFPASTSAMTSSMSKAGRRRFAPPHREDRRGDPAAEVADRRRVQRHDVPVPGDLRQQMGDHRPEGEVGEHHPLGKSRGTGRVADPPQRVRAADRPFLVVALVDDGLEALPARTSATADLHPRPDGGGNPVGGIVVEPSGVSDEGGRLCVLGDRQELAWVQPRQGRHADEGAGVTGMVRLDPLATVVADDHHPVASLDTGGP
jgi:hypothetical protein